MSIFLLLYILIGTIIGLIMGALPGLTVTMTMVLVVSLTFGWHMIDALAFIIGAFCGGGYGRFYICYYLEYSGHGCCCGYRV